ncbi:hypothetical protein [Pedobacter endophyticus]|uniref:Uncharacterized protein n=1 Tax=Pedobacter endophyticus TaxID=2789740 RepID=A0A7S9L0J6_9SPHI|nr:hypothetical protein [Pedobacter endophyticus]QPH40275.1 hypothetical protein IZT61_03065 [Pedobacter endophyticus]
MKWIAPKHAGKGYAPNSLTIYPLTEVDGNEMQSAKHSGKGYAAIFLNYLPVD